MKKRILSMLLAMAMLLGLMPMSVFAEATEPVVVAEPAEAAEATDPTEATEEAIEQRETAVTVSYVVASGTCGENLTWVLTDDGVLTISGTGAMADYSYGAAPWFDYIESITGVVIENGVTSIGDSAFSDCSSLTSVTIPDSVTSIGDWAFSDCTGLNNITIPDSVADIGEWAFYHCSSLTNITIPDSVTNIGSGAFCDCNSLTEITLPDSVISIGAYAFEYCSSLTDITIPDSVTGIGDWAFSWCSGLTNITIPDSVTSIGDGTFNGCSSLTDITIPDSVTSIGDYAFADCSSLTGITIPDGVTSIGDFAFGWCVSLTEITFKGNAPTIGKNAFVNVTATASYPAGNATWTESVMQNYGGTITWVAVAHEHEWSEWVLTKAPTCTEKGEETRTCSVCGATEKREVAMTDHSFGEWKQTKAPTCTEKGEEARTCSTCGETETREVAALGHSFGQWQEYDSINHYRTCACGAITEVSEHHWDEGVLTHTCKDCGATYAVISAESFSFDCHNKTGYVGETGVLGYSFEPYGASETVTMVSSDPTVASVEYEEEYNICWIYYHQLGTAVITATTVSGLTDSCTVTVVEKEEVFLDQPFTVTVQPHDEVLFEFTAETTNFYSFYSENGDGNLNINWRGKPYYGNGVDTQRLYGTFVLAVWNDSDTVRTYTLCVREAVPVEGIIFEQDHYYGYQGDRMPIRVSLYPVWSIPEEPVFSSSDEDVVYYDPVGSRWVTLANPGTATITATAKNGVSAQCTVTVLDYDPIQVGDSKTITLDYQAVKRYEFMPEASGRYVFYMPETDIEYVWNEEDGTYIKVSKEFSLSIMHDAKTIGDHFWQNNYVGVWCEMEAGETYILNAYNWSSSEEAITGTVTLEEMRQPDRITIDGPRTVFIDSGDSFDYYNFTLTCLGDKLPFLVDNVTWTVSDENVVTLFDCYEDRAFFTPTGFGTATITATLDNGVSASWNVTVAENVHIEVIEGAWSSILAGSGESLTVKIDHPVNKFDYVMVDGQVVPPEYYTVTEGSTIVTLDHRYLDTLGADIYTISIYFTDGRATTYFTICNTFCGENLTWTLDSQGTLIISGTGAMDDFADYTVPWVSKRSEIKSVVIDNGVTSIGDWAFFGCDDLSSVSIPNSVTSIGDYAFCNCSRLTSVTIPEGVANIGDYAFAHSNLTDITIPDSVTCIGEGPFNGCRILRGIWVSEGNPSYSSDESGVLLSKEKTTLIQCPGGIEGIYSIPASVTSIGDYAFSFCSSLSSVTIPGSVTSIGEWAFGGCSSLKGIWVGEDNPNYSSDKFGVLFDKGKSTLIQCPGGIAGIYSIPASVTSIGEGAFESCESLSSVIIPASVTSIGGWAFSGCTSLKEITFIGEAPTIGEYAFGEVTATAYYPAGNATWTEEVMQNYGGTLTWVAVAHEHEWSERVLTKEPTCTEKGEEIRTCSTCGHIETREVEALGHSYESVVTAPTCTEQGYSTHTCTRCGDSRVDTYVDALGHKYGEWKQTKAPTCTEKGEEARTCGRCGVTETHTVDALGHKTELKNAKDATCTEAGYTSDEICTVCGETVKHGEEIPALGHDYKTVVTAPTCTEKGHTTHTCTRCDTSYVDTYVDALGHKTELKNAKEATCTETGYTGDEICAVCGGTVKKGEAVAALGHSFGEWKQTKASTCTEKGEETRTCSVCGATEKREVAALGHKTVLQNVKDATCTETGYTGDEICTVCGGTVKQGKEIPALGHDYKAVVTAPTCTEKGYTTHTCTRCGESYVDTYEDALGHKTALQNAKDATCTEAGYTGDEICTICGETIMKGEAIAALGHSFGEWKQTKAPTCTEKGEETRTCSVCGGSEKREVAALGHKLTLVPGVTPDYAKPGMKEHYVCEVCGKLFADEAGTVEVTEEELVIPQLIQVENGKTEIDKEVIDSTAENVEHGGEVKLPVADAGEVKRAELPVQSLTQVADKEASLTVEMTAATVTMDSAALEAVARQSGEQDAVTLEITEISKEDLTEAQQEAVKDKNVVNTISAQLLVNDQPIASEADGGFGDGRVTVKIPFTPDPGTTAADYKVLYVAGDGATAEIPTAYEDGCLVIVLEHFSDYVIVKTKTVMLGDINGDGKITVTDLMCLANHLAGKAEINEANSDLDGNGKVNVTDLMRLANVFAGKATLN